ncbi:MAG TPA: hypothetical protein DCP63_15695, partial [Bacteroidetes bacterium]|nr:hypothetical protein [Bacteroidota bacterium]
MTLRCRSDCSSILGLKTISHRAKPSRRIVQIRGLRPSKSNRNEVNASTFELVEHVNETFKGERNGVE